MHIPLMNATTNTVKAATENYARAIVGFLNATVRLAVAEGKQPVHTEFGYEMGVKHARIFAVSGSYRTARAFVCADGSICKSESWKKVGRVIGGSNEDVMRAVLGPVLSRP